MRRTLGGSLVAIGVVIVAGGLFGYVSTRRFVDRAARGEGTVARVEIEDDSGDGGTSFRPVVQFRTASGARVEFKSRQASNPAAYGEGDAVTVLYEPGAPDRAEIEGFWSLWFPTLLCGLIGAVFGAVFVAVGAVVLLAPLFRRPAPHGLP